MQLNQGSTWRLQNSINRQEPTESSKQPIRARYLGHVTGYQPISDQYFLIRSVPVNHLFLREDLEELLKLFHVQFHQCLLERSQDTKTHRYTNLLPLIQEYIPHTKIKGEGQGIEEVFHKPPRHIQTRYELLFF